MLGREWHRDEAGSGIGRADIAARRIDVDADEIDRSTDRVHVLSGDLRSIRAGSCQEGVAVAAFHDRGQVRRIELAGGELGRLDMLGRLDDGYAYADVLRRPGLRARARARANRLDRKPVGEQRMMPHLVQPAGWQLQPGREDAGCMAEFHERRELVEREEMPGPVAELFGDVTGIVRERLGGVAPFPPAAILQRLRQVPVIERWERRDVVGGKVVEEPVVEVEALRIWRAAALRKYPWPRNGEPVRSGGERLHRLHVVSISVIVIVGDVAVVVVADLSRRVRECVPYRWATAILADGAFDLIGGGGGRRRPEGGRTDRGKLASRELCGHGQLRD